MNARKELVDRVALKRRQKIGTLSDEAFSELELAVREDPFKFIDDDEESAFALVVQALARYDESRRDDDLLDDEQFAQAREQRFRALVSSCQQALAIDQNCLDAALLVALVGDEEQNAIFENLCNLHAKSQESEGRLASPVTGDAWTNVFLRPQLRVQAALSRACIHTARFRMAVDQCTSLLATAPLDALGARFTCALAMARLEDEDGFNWLDARESRRGNAWFHLSRAILMYKLGRIPAARRALKGYDRLCVGGAYLLLQPVFVDIYLPDRPAFAPGSFEETMLAVHEADPVIADVPDFAAWACDVPGFLASAQDFCARNGFEWRDWE
ncbi:MAG: hypothetical protein Q4A07_11675 [Coriobacteriales bacterium]|nr:hypothetical protein [Coriobacteriales bacterium]